MATRARRSAAATRAADAEARRERAVDEAARLLALGLADGDEIRWHDPGRSTWTKGRVSGVGQDGSLSCAEHGGKQRAIRPEHAEVLRRSARGALVWRSVVTENRQLPLFVEPARPLRPEVEARVVKRRRTAN